MEPAQSHSEKQNFVASRTIIEMYSVDCDSNVEAQSMIANGRAKLMHTRSTITVYLKPGQKSTPIVPYKQWPLWAKALKQVAKPEDRGIGDVVARIIGDENSEAFKAWYLATFKKPCGCKGRQARWNQMYPSPREP